MLGGGCWTQRVRIRWMSLMKKDIAYDMYIHCTIYVYSWYKAVILNANCNSYL